jgi:hypothetical protein
VGLKREARNCSIFASRFADENLEYHDRGLAPFRRNLQLCYTLFMRDRRGPELLSWLRLNKVSALIALLAVLSHALASSGWMPAFASTPGQGLSIIICTTAGVAYVQIGADGQPIKQAPDEGGNHDHQCCPCAGSRPLAPPLNVFVVVLPKDAERSLVLPTPVETKPLALVLTPHSPRAPPALA